MNIIFDNVKIYGVQDQLDVILNVTFIIEPLEDFPVGFEVFSSKDPVLAIADDDRTVTTGKIGKSVIKFMTGDTVHKSILINVVSSTGPNATTLNGALGRPVPDAM